MNRVRLASLARSFAFVLLGPGLLAGLLPWALAMRGWGPALVPHGARCLAWPLWAIGSATLLHCAWLFGTQARSSPFHLHRPRELLISGVYGHVRNPMYLAQLALIVGHFLWFGAPVMLLYLLNYALGVVLLALGYEEPRLLRLFGERYAAYRDAVPGWWPRLRPYVGHDAE